MVASIIGKVIAECARDRTEETPRGVLVYFPAAARPGPDHPIEQARKRLEALEMFPWAPPAGNA